MLPRIYFLITEMVLVALEMFVPFWGWGWESTFQGGKDRGKGNVNLSEPFCPLPVISGKLSMSLFTCAMEVTC